jgi:hypothetical protein
VGALSIVGSVQTSKWLPRCKKVIFLVIFAKMRMYAIDILIKIIEVYFMIYMSEFSALISMYRCKTSTIPI